MDKIPSVSLFAKVCFGWEAFDYQVNPLNDTTSRVLIVSGRQVGNLAKQLMA